MQRPASGTRCSAFAFMRSAGIVHVAAAKSTSSQVARRASPLRAAVSTRNSNSSFVPAHAWLSLTRRTASATSL